MDPNACLAALRLLAENIEAREDATDTTDLDASGLAAGFRNLDAWLSRGGFLPDDWARPREPA